MHVKALLLNLILFCPGALPGQNTDTLFQVADRFGNTWSRRIETSIQTQGSDPVVLHPVGEVPLYRLRKTVLEFAGLEPGDTLNISLANKTGIPFHSIRFAAGKDTERQWKKTPAVQFQVFSQTATEARLELVPAISIQRQYAMVSVQKFPVARRDTSITVTDSLLNQGADASMDTLLRRYCLLKESRRLLLQWTRDSLGLKRQSGTLIAHDQPGVRTRLLSETHRMSKPKHPLLIPFSGFAAGDTLLIRISTQGKKPLESVYLRDPAGGTLSAGFALQSFVDTVLVRTDSVLELDIRGPKGQYAQVDLLRIRPQRADSFYLVVDSCYARTVTSVYDTLALTLADDSLSIAPIWNIESRPWAEQRIAVPTVLPDGHALGWMAYWVGIGEACMQDWITLESGVPPEWGLPGATPALGAFGLGRALALPAVRTKEVSAGFSRVGGKPLPVAAQPLDGLPGGRNSGVLRPEALREFSVGTTDPVNGLPEQAFYVRFRNSSTVNTYPVRIRMAGFYRKRLSQEEALVFQHTRTQKIPLSP